MQHRLYPRSVVGFFAAFFLILILLASVPRLNAQVSFQRGDANADGRVSLADSLTIFSFLFSDGMEPSCLDAADTDDDGTVGASDIAAVVSAVHANIPPPAFGPDPTADDLTCESYQVVEAEVSDTALEIGAATANPGGLVEIPVFVTNSEGIEAYQLIVQYDSELFTPLLSGDFDEAELPEFWPSREYPVSFEHTIYESLVKDDDADVVTSSIGEGILLLTVVPRGLSPRDGGALPDLPAEEHARVFSIRGMVSFDAQPDTVIKIEPNDGPGENGHGPLNLVNELTQRSPSAPMAVRPKLVAGSMNVEAAMDFKRGDVNTDGRVSLTDSVAILDYLFLFGPAPTCLDAADANDAGHVNIADAAAVISAIFLQGAWRFPMPPPLFGQDPTPDALTCDAYDVVEAEATDDVLEIGDVTGAPGEIVDIPVFLTNSKPIEAYQLVLKYNPEVFRPDSPSFEGSFYQSEVPDFADIKEQGEAVFLLGVVPDFVPPFDGHPTPPGERQRVFNIRGQILPGAERGTVSMLEPTNGPEGRGTGEYNLMNELTVRGETRVIAVYPRTVPGPLKVSADIIIFLRGDVNIDGKLDQTDAIVLLDRLFLGGPPLRCPDAADADDNGKLELTDAIGILRTAFLGDSTVAPPFPKPGRDPTPDSLGSCDVPVPQ